jgi:hypothetical protein
MSICLASGNDAKRWSPRCIHHRKEHLIQPAQRNEAGLLVVAASVLALEHRALEDSDRAGEVDAVLPQIGLPLRRIPFEPFGTVYTNCIHVKPLPLVVI